MLHRQSVERLKGFNLSPEQLISLFEELAKAAESLDSGSTECSMSYINESDEFEVGTYVPEIIFVVRKVLDDPTVEQQL